MPAFSENVQLSDDTPRCPRCGKRVSAVILTCPACGYEFVPRQSRIGCSRCGSRIPADSVQCPRCGADPRISRFPGAARLGLIVFASLLLVCCGWVIFRAFTTNTLARALGLISEPSRTPTQAVQIIYVVATTARPTTPLKPSPTTTPTSRFSPTPTRRGARTPTPSRAGSTPAQGLYAAPQLVAPLNATVYEQGTNPAILLEWQPVSPNGLRENEWYMISLSYTARDGKAAKRVGWSKETKWKVNKDWYMDVDGDTHVVNWNVLVMRVEGLDPFSSPATPGSPPSATFLFFWK